MKKLIISFCAFFLFADTLFGQGCYPDNLEITTVAEMDSFIANTPNCRVIEGKLTIKPKFGEDIDFSTFNQIDSILGSFDCQLCSSEILEEFTNLKFVGNILRLQRFSSDTVSGLKNLTQIEGGFWLDDCYNLKSFEGLNRLKIIGDDFDINQCQTLPNFKGLDSLNFIGGDLYTSRPYQLHTFEGLENLDSIGGSIRFSSTELTDYQGLRNLKKIGGQLLVSNQKTLTNLSGLENLREVGALQIQVNQELLNLDALSGLISCPEINIVNHNELTSVDFRNVKDLKEFKITYCRKIESLENIPQMADSSILEITSLRAFTGTIPGNIKIAESITISNNETLPSISGLENLEEVLGTIIISSDDLLENFRPLINLKSIGRYLYVLGNDNLKTLEGLGNLKTLNGIFLSRNQRLENITALKNIPSTAGELEFSISVNENPELKNLNGLQFVKKIGGGLEILENEGLQNLSGLENLTTVNRGIQIIDNDVLQNINALENFRYAYQDSSILKLNDNPELETMEGLKNFNFTLLDELEIYDNPQLSICNYEKLCNFLDIPSSFHTIYGNAAGCDSYRTILEVCRDSVISKLIDFENDLKINVFPNPTTGKINISGSLSKETEITILSPTGRIIKTEKLAKSKEVILPETVNGLLILKLETSDEIIIKKILKTI